jgi:protein arginine N-methyltransferase 1
MYSVDDYGQMIADKPRMDAYVQALRRFVKPGSTVLDLGAGTGIFSLLACQYGARKVYAVETSDAIAIARQIAQANGLADRIEFIQAASTEISLLERVDVIVSDMHGSLPLFHTNVASILDARRRMLADHGVLIPQRESLWAAVVELPEEYGRLVSPWAKDGFQLNMDAARVVVTNSLTRTRVDPNQLLAEPQCWGVLDYATMESASVSAKLSFPVARAGVAHGLVLWFDCVLADGIALSNAPGKPKLTYVPSFLPWSAPVPMEREDKIRVHLRADYTGTGYTWTWESEVSGNVPGEIKAHFRQSTFWGTPLSQARLRKRAGSYRPALTPDGQVDAAILGAMDGATSLEDIVRTIMRQFPARFPSFAEALARVANLSETYGGHRKE